MRFINRKTIGLSAVTAVIIAFWLVPGVNTAKESEYVRLYEDVWKTNSEEMTLTASNTLTQDSTGKGIQKRYRKETIKPGKEAKVSGKIFSRAMQFRPLDEVTEDSVVVVNYENDSIPAL